MENYKINVEGETKKTSRKTIVLDVVIAIVAVLFCIYGLSWCAWLFDSHNFIWILKLAIGILSGIIAVIAFLSYTVPKNGRNWLKSRLFPSPFLNMSLLTILCIINMYTLFFSTIFSWSGYAENDAPKRWGNCMVDGEYGALFSKFGHQIANCEKFYRVYNEDWEKCFLAVDVEKETEKVDWDDDYDERIEITLSAKVFDKNGNYMGGLSPYYGTVYELSRSYRDKHKEASCYKYDNDDKFFRVSEAKIVILVKYLDREKFYLAEDYDGYPTQVRPAPKPKPQQETYSINVSANPNNGGGVTGGGTYDKGKSCTVTASANSGYSFTNWTENGNEVSTNASYTFTVSVNRSLVANFKSKSSPQPPEPVRQPQPFQVWQECFMCGGSGQCRYCYGLGWAANGKDTCGICHGTGKCSQCAGHGGKNVIEYH